MTNTKFRKRALLSSVAMLLVALIALGSATFAWFSVQRTATASYLDASTTKSSSLVISQVNDGGWTNTLTFVDKSAAANTKAADVSVDSLNPVTFDKTNWKYGTAPGYDLGYRGAALADVPSNDPTGSYACAAPVYVKYGNAGGSGTFHLGLDVTIASGNATAQVNDTNYARVAIVPIPTTDSTVSVTTGSTTIIGADANDFNKDPSSYSAANMTASASTTYTSTTNTNIDLGTINEGAVYGFMIYAYYEGTDLDCIDTYSGTHFTASLNFKEL